MVVVVVVILAVAVAVVVVAVVTIIFYTLSLKYVTLYIVNKLRFLNDRLHNFN